MFRELNYPLTSVANTSLIKLHHINRTLSIELKWVNISQLTVVVSGPEFTIFCSTMKGS